jgi:hypothetical protein
MAAQSKDGNIKPNVYCLLGWAPCSLVNEYQISEGDSALLYEETMLMRGYSSLLVAGCRGQGQLFNRIRCCVPRCDVSGEKGTGMKYKMKM